MFRAGWLRRLWRRDSWCDTVHIGVNGRRVDIPSSFTGCAVGDRFALISKMAKSPLVGRTRGRFGRSVWWFQLSDWIRACNPTALPDETYHGFHRAAAGDRVLLALAADETRQAFAACDGALLAEVRGRHVGNGSPGDGTFAVQIRP